MLPPTPVLKLFIAALRKCGAMLAPGFTPSDEQQEECKDELNRMIGSLNCGALNIFTKRIDLYDTVADQQIYTLGQDPAGLVTPDWNGPRPTKITFANFLFPTSPAIRREMNLLTDKQWGRITYQDIKTYPRDLYNDGGYDNGMAKIYLYPIPDAVYQIELFTRQSLAKVESIDDDILFPDGYEEAFVHRLAVALGPMVTGREAPVSVQQRAVTSWEMLRSLNAAVPAIRTDDGASQGGGYYNYLSGLVEND